MLPVMCGVSHAAQLSGNLIKHVYNDKPFYAAGDTANITLALTNGTGASYTGNIKMAVCSRGVLIGYQTSAVSSLASGSSQNVTFSQTAPSSYKNHGYLLVFAALTSSDSGGVSCTGTGTSSSSPVDVATGAINIAANAQEDPIEGFIDAPTISQNTSVTAAQVAQNMSQYHIGLIQGYDLAWRHDEPYPTSNSWDNLSGVPMTKTMISNYASAYHSYGMKFLAYSLWDGAWPDYLTANTNLNLSEARFTTACGSGSGTCTIANQGYTSLGSGCSSWGWSACAIYYMNPGNGNWQAWMGSQFKKLMTMGFDGIHIDTLGDDGQTYYDYKGRTLPNLGGYLADFTNYVQIATGGVTDINQVSGWNLQDVAVRGISKNLYIEPHPEFNNYASYPSYNGLTQQLSEWTSRKLVTAYYLQQVKSGVLSTSNAVNGESVTVCDPSVSGSANCLANNPGVALMMGQVANSGGSPLVLGDYDHIVPGPFFPRASLGMDANLQQYMGDFWNWYVGQRDILRVGTADASTVVSITNSNSAVVNSSVGAAGYIYTRPFYKAGLAIGLDMTNLIGVSDNRIDDPDGTHKPTAQSSLTVTMGYFGNVTPGNLWYTAPDINHGIPQQISYSAGSTTGTITFTLPSLLTTGVVYLESGALSNTQDFTMGSSDYIPGSSAVSWSNGMGNSSGSSVHGCCGRSAKWENIDLGSSGVTTLSANVTSVPGGTVEFRVDSPTGTLLAQVNVPAGSSGLSITSPVSNSPTGVHSVYMVFPNRDVQVNYWKP